MVWNAWRTVCPQTDRVGLLDVRGVLGAGLHELNAEGIRQLLALLTSVRMFLNVFVLTHVEPFKLAAVLGLIIGDHLLGRQVALVAHQKLVHAVRRILVNLLQRPCLYTLHPLCSFDAICISESSFGPGPNASRC